MGGGRRDGAKVQQSDVREGCRAGGWVQVRRLKTTSLVAITRVASRTGEGAEYAQN